MLRLLHNLAIAMLLGALVLDAAPAGCAGHRRIKAKLDPVLDTAGLWQGSWRLFAPNVDHINTYVTATVTYTDGSTWTWESTRWEGRSQLQKLQQGRHPKLTDNFRLDKRRRLWPSLARWIARQAPARLPAAPAKVELFRHWWEVPAPQALAAAQATLSRVPPPRAEFPNHFKYHTETLR